MAHPIYCFAHPQTKKRFYQIWDTVMGYPLTIPMELITLIQYWGIYNEDRVGALYVHFEHFIKNGTTLKFETSSDLPKLFQKQAFDYINLNVDPLNQIEEELNSRLESLFFQDLDFFDFYNHYLELIKGISIHPKRQQNYYLSWAHTMRFEVINQQTKKIIKDIFDEFSLPLTTSKNRMFSMDEWFKKELFNKNPKAMAKLFYLLGKNNLISLDAIPHILRINKDIQSLFQKFGMEKMLPNKSIKYDINDPFTFKYKEFDEIKFLRQFANLLSFSYYNGEELIGVPIEKMKKKEIQSLLRETVYVFTEKIVNFMDKYGNIRLPMMYANYFIQNENDKFLYLAPYDRQRYHIFNQNGNLIDDGEYYDFHFIDEYLGYFQNTDGLSWVRWSYNPLNYKVDKNPVIIENDLLESDWNRIEQNYQNEIIGNSKKLQEDHFRIIDLVFGKKNDWISLSIFSYNGITEKIINEVFQRKLNKVFKIKNVKNNVFQIGLELYKELICNDLITDFYPANLNVFEICFNLDSLLVQFQQKYSNDIVNEILSIDNSKSRSLYSFHSLKIIDDLGHSKSEIVVYFKVNKSSKFFKKDCMGFLRINPKEDTESISEYGERFIGHLTNLGYDEEPSYNYCLDNRIVIAKKNLGKVGKSSSSGNNKKDDFDDLPF